jgi:hypothetical protein
VARSGYLRKGLLAGGGLELVGGPIAKGAVQPGAVVPGDVLHGGAAGGRPGRPGLLVEALAFQGREERLGERGGGRSARCGSRDLHRLPPDPTARADLMRCDAVPAEHPEPGLSGWKDPSAQPAGRGLLMPYQSTDPSWASRLSSPGRRDANTSSPAAAVPASLGPAELPELSDPATAGRTRWGRRSGSSGPSEPGRTRSSRRSTATRRTVLGVRRPLIAQMPADRREQAISAIADLLVVQLEREA